ncbi:OmpP1/FadL family transporter [Roseibium sp. RKSG952]|uniref:OmpP1/FadL family transporter n=1 Tax=Roseibium sp. RKSG952 TaxID=2529384 RepID=UPI0012BCC45D|nr:outer membrane protein transport protein [Roseibium sp. RKSG952]MTH95219.1 long-chain fatty acid transporter [Roseibium sp. RKSG952]
MPSIHISLSASICGLTAALAVTITPSPTEAGGFWRGEADTEILFVEGKRVVRLGAIYASPMFDFTTIGGLPATDTNYSQNFWSPNLGFKLQILPNLACAATYFRPFGQNGEYGPQALTAETGQAIAAGEFPNPTTSSDFRVDEYAGTCAQAFKIGPGRMHLIGGVFYHDFDYINRTVLGDMELNDGGFGFRAGAAYEIPEYAMRVQIIYRSEVDHDAPGTFYTSDLGQAAGLPGSLPATGYGTLPQSIEIYAQTGVAEDWLVFGALQWTQWSELPQFDYSVQGLGDGREIFNYSDGLVVELGTGHAFTDQLAGFASLTWDQGVGSGADIATDMWMARFGAEYDTRNGVIGAGVAIARVNEGKQRYADGAPFDATADPDWAFGFGVNFTLPF